MADEMDKTDGAIARLDVARRKKQAATGFVTRWLEIDLMLNDQSKPYCNAENVRRVLVQDKHFGSLAWYDADAKLVMSSDEIWSDDDDIDLLTHIQADYGLARMSLEAVRQGVNSYARTKARAPLTDWLNGLTWDGTARLPMWLTDAYGCLQSDYTSAAGRCWLMSMVARAFKPGCQVDTMIVLEGEQGVRKSTSLEVLGGQWYRAITQPFGTKEWLEAITGVVWLAEVADLSGFRGRDLDHLKAALTTRVDRYRRSYDRRALDYPRRCVFAGTTNRDDWQADDSGARRFLPVRVSEVNLEFIRSQREQLFAEAVHRYREGEAWWDLPIVEAAAEVEQRRDVDVWEDKVDRWLGDRKEVTTSDLLEICLGIEAGKQDKRVQMRVTSILKVLGFQRSLTYEGQRRIRVWKRGGSKNTTGNLFGGGSK